jgi:hypothetical protein
MIFMSGSHRLSFKLSIFPLERKEHSAREREREREREFRIPTKKQKQVRYKPVRSVD